ncbi:hypothetical protein [Nocardia arthritidis]|uniref:Uncharacterized protein n=1 Tax=Nocardia arthritidis TaxID=228602 RepID=A0A6G9Y4S6_9NOCA|nr:hypothetical protein [Nocardia arthritidis]QIS08202.1 hypothetical protein F5544_01395 [Nocardia arthritidis]
MEHIAFGDTLLTRVHYYRTAFAIPCHTSGGRILVTVGGQLRAVTMPQPLASDVVGILSRTTGSVPVIVHGRAMVPRWTFLTGYSAVADDDWRVNGLMLATGCTLVPVGGLVPLPSPGDPRLCRWLDPVRSNQRPPLDVVLDAVRLVHLGIPRW